MRTLLLFLFLPSLAFGATGDVLFNCDFTGAGTPQEVVLGCGAENDFTPNGMAHASIETGGHDGGSYLKYAYPDEGELNEGFNFLVGRSEITLTYWEKFSVPASVSDGWNVKSTRAYCGAAGCDFIGAIMSRWASGHWNHGVFNYADAIIEPGYSNHNPDVITDYCVPDGSEYDCGNSSDYGAIAISSLLSDTGWHKVRIHYKMPPAGEATLWIDGTLVYRLYNLTGPPPVYCATPWGALITKIVVQPSDDFMDGYASTTYDHGYDDIVMYEGYVPPAVTSSARQGGGKARQGLGHFKQEAP